MATNYVQYLVNTPQSEPDPLAKAPQVKNSAGGYTFQLSPRAQLERFLILGTDGGTYYASERKLTVENARCITACLDADGLGTVEAIAQISESGRAPKNDAAVFALAMASGHKDATTRAAALAALPRVCRIGTHLFQYVNAVQAFRGWGRGLKRAVGAWYGAKSADDLAYQVAKYAQRDGWSHRDVLRLAHTEGHTPEHHAIYRYVVAGADGSGDRLVRRKNQPGAETHYSGVQIPEFLSVVDRVRKPGMTEAETIAAIRRWRLTHEMISSDHLKSTAVWDALLQHMPQTAMIRSLARMTANGLLRPMSSASRLVCERLTDVARIGGARVHPIQYLSALLTYKQGRGEKGSLTWDPDRQIVDALDAGFYEAFGVLEPSGARTLLGIDVSGSMDMGTIAGIPGLTPRYGAAAMAMVTARVEKQWHVMGFSHEFVDIPITPRMRLDDVVHAMARIPMGATDCALPMLYAMQRKIDVDTFAVYTDNETWCGHIHPHSALGRYRAASGLPSRLAVVGMTATNFTIADPTDAGQMDVVGFDTAAPQILSNFSKEGLAPRQGR